MNIRENTRHSWGLFVLSLGGMGAVIGAICFVMGVAEAKAGLFGCGAGMLLPGLWLVRSGLRIRNRAVAAGSTMHLEGGDDVRTSVTGKGHRRETRDNDF